MCLIDKRVAPAVADILPTSVIENPRAKLLDARACMEEALLILDEFSLSSAAANLDMAIHQLDRELAAPPPDSAEGD